MKVLLIEDKQDYIDDLQPELAKDFEVKIAESRDSAFDLLENDSFDLIICDRKIPAIDGSLDAEFEHGDAVIGKAWEVCPGTPLLVNTGFESTENAKEILRQSKSVDLYGTGEHIQIYDSFNKLKLDELLASVAKHTNGLRGLLDVAITGDLALLDGEARKIIGVFARRKNCLSAEVEGVSEGFSGAKVFKVTFSGEAGVPDVPTILKVQDLVSHFDELARYQNYVSGPLQGGSYAVFVDQVDSGAGRLGGLFYRLADQNSQSLFAQLNSDPIAAAASIRQLQARLNPWNNKPHLDRVRIEEIRQILLADNRMPEVVPSLGDINYLAFEKRELLAKRGIGHLDLHGANVLTQTDQTALLIDYGNVGPSFLAIDPVYLELSILFHPAAGDVLGTWPTEDEAQQWADIDAYTALCPVPDFIKACRSWAMTTDNAREVLAAAYAASISFLRHKDSDKDIAIAIIKGVIHAFDA